MRSFVDSAGEPPSVVRRVEHVLDRGIVRTGVVVRGQVLVELCVRDGNVQPVAKILQIAPA